MKLTKTLTNTHLKIFPTKLSHTQTETARALFWGYEDGLLKLKNIFDSSGFPSDKFGMLITVWKFTR